MTQINTDVIAQEKGLKYVHVNSRSLYNKLQEIHNAYNCCDVIVVTESWLNSSIPDAAMAIPNFRLIRQDRYKTEIKKGGGICTYVRDGANVEHLEKLSSVTDDYEISVVKIKFTNIKPSYVIGVYRPPKGTPYKLFDRLTEICDNLDLQRNELFIMGDFNINYNDKQSLRKLHVQNFESQFDVHQLIDIVM